MSAHLLSTVGEAAPSRCHHCGATLGRGAREIMVSGREAQVCGDACRTAVETIANAGLDAWYGLRTHSDAQGASTADPRHRAELDAWRVPEVEASVVRRTGDDGGHGGHEPGRSAHGTCAVTLTVEGMRCAGCAWLVEGLLTSAPGVDAATVDFPLRRAEVRFDARATRLHVLLETLARAGYRAAPYTVHAEEAGIESERRAHIRGLGISAVFGMQVMLLSIALYASDHHGGMDAGFEQLFRWLAMVLTVPVLVWPGRAFFTGAAAALRSRRLTMDVPVALGLSIAFLGSVFATLAGEGEVWFDSVVMFVTLLNGARYLELLARRRATAAIRALARSAPLVATRVPGSGGGSGAGGGMEGRTGIESPSGRGRAKDWAENGISSGNGNRTGIESPGGSGAGDGTGNRAGTATTSGSKAGDRTEGTPSGNGAGSEGAGTMAERAERAEGAERVPAAALRPGDRVRIRPGEVVPADGEIRSGHSAFDEALLTGESNPAPRSAGETVLAGSVNGSGVVEVEVRCAGDETVLGGVLRRAGQAARERPAIAVLADRAAAWFIAGVLVLAAGVAVGWLLHDPARMVPVLVSVLVVTCPCALSLATPAAMTAALGALARAGLVATRANAVERLALATHCLADKTGTLTEGRFRLRSVSALAGVPESRCLALAAALERYAAHPVASAIIAAAADGPGEREAAVAPSRGPAGGAQTTPGPADCCSGSETGSAGLEARGRGSEARATTPESAGSRPETRAAALESAGSEPETRTTAPESAGSELEARTSGPEAARADPVVEDASADIGGVTGRIGGVRYAVGSADYVARACGLVPGVFGIDPGGATHVFLARTGTLLARFTLADTLRTGANALVEGLRARGVETTIASGDSAGAVERAARALGVAHHLAGLSPEDKLREAARLAARGERVLMLGDGVNDTPALAGAHVSVAMGRGAAAAAARADAVLIGDDPGRLLAGLDVARRARRIVKQNLAWALGYNLVALPLAAAGAVPPWAAAIGMSLSSLAVAGNALRLGRAPNASGTHGTDTAHPSGEDEEGRSRRRGSPSTAVTPATSWLEGRGESIR